MEVSSYGGNATESSGLVRILKDLSASIEGEDVLIVEDIIDTGLTLNYLIRYLRGKNPATLRICTLLDKPARRLVEIPVDYIGFEIPDQFVVGYGLDYGEVYRNLRYVGVLKPEVYGAAAEGEAARMTMHRRPLGQGRTMAALGGVIILVGCLLPWWQVGGGEGLPVVTGNAFEGSGILVFLRRRRHAWPSSPCPTPSAIARPASTAGCRSPSSRVVGWLGSGLAGRSTC